MSEIDSDSSSGESPNSSSSPDNFLVPDPVRPTIVPKLKGVIQELTQPSHSKHRSRTRANTRRANHTVLRSDISLSDLADTESSSASSASAAASSASDAAEESDGPPPADVAVDADPEDGDSATMQQPASPPAAARRRPRRQTAPLTFVDAFQFVEQSSKAAREARATAEARRRGMMEAVFDADVPSHVYSAANAQETIANAGTSAARRARSRAARQQEQKKRRLQRRTWQSDEDSGGGITDSGSDCEDVGIATPPPRRQPRRSWRRRRWRRWRNRGSSAVRRDGSNRGSGSNFGSDARNNSQNEGDEGTWATLVAQWREDVVRDVQAFARRCGRDRERVVYKCRSVGGSRAVQVLEAVAKALGVETSVLRRGGVWDVELIKEEGRVIAFGETVVRREAERAVDELVPAGDGLSSDASEQVGQGGGYGHGRVLLDLDSDDEEGQQEPQEQAQGQEQFQTVSPSGQQNNLQRVALIDLDGSDDSCSNGEHDAHESTTAASPPVQTSPSQPPLQTISLDESDDDSLSVVPTIIEQPAPHTPARNDRLHDMQTQVTSEVLAFVHACKSDMRRYSHPIPCACGQAGMVPLLEAIARKLDVRVERVGGSVACPGVSFVKESMTCLRWDDAQIRRFVTHVFADLRRRRGEDGVVDVDVDVIDVDVDVQVTAAVDDDIAVVGDVRQRPSRSAGVSERPLQRRRMM